MLFDKRRRFFDKNQGMKNLLLLQKMKDRLQKLKDRVTPVPSAAELSP